MGWMCGPSGTEHLLCKCEALNSNSSPTKKNIKNKTTSKQHPKNPKKQIDKPLAKPDEKRLNLIILDINKKE
jgi:hypothetical protein